MRRVPVQLLPFRSFCLVLLLCLLAPEAVPAQEETTPEALPPGFVSFLQLSDAATGLRAEALVAVGWFHDRYARLLLIETPAGQRVVLSVVRLPEEGLLELALRLEGSDWSAVLREASSVRLGSVRELADPAAVAARHGAGSESTWELEAPGLSGLLRVSTDGGSAAARELLLQEIHRREGTEQLVAAMPHDARQALAFLQGLATGCEDCRALPLEESMLLVELLAELAGSAEPAPHAGLAWHAEPLAAARTVDGLNAPARSFLARFSTIPADEPLADLAPHASRPR